MDHHHHLLLQQHVMAKGCSSSSTTTTTTTSSGGSGHNYNVNGGGSVVVDDDDEMNMMSTQDLRRGPWTVDEDFALINYIDRHGEGRWNSLARCAGLKRTGKSCRLRWLNYLRPDVRRGNITLEEQLLILELHSRWGNRWSKIAQHLPGRTDNEIKNYWRTRVQKHAKQLKCDVNSKQFKDTMRYLWMPRLVERIQAAAAASSTAAAAANSDVYFNQLSNTSANNVTMMTQLPPQQKTDAISSHANYSSAGNGGGADSSESFGTQFSPVSDMTDCYNYYNHGGDNAAAAAFATAPLISPTGYSFSQGLDMQFMDQNNSSAWMTRMMMDGGDASENLWNNVEDDSWFLQQQQQNNVNYNYYNNI